MRTLNGLPIPALLLALVLYAPTLAADSPAPLGALLSKHYPAMAPDETAVVLVYLKDKGPSGRRELYDAADLLSPRAIARREKVRGPGNAITAEDLPVDRSYVDGVSALATRTRHVLRWFNAVSVEATRSQIDALRRLSFVKEIELVGRWRGTPEPELAPSKDAPDEAFGTQARLLNYGASLTQNEQIGVANVHDLGIFGEGVIVGVFDNGFRLLNHEAFSTMEIVAQYDFVDNKVSVIPRNLNSAFGSHGVNTLSTIGGYKPGQLIGPAFRAKYVLARTENDSSETPVEEDNWAAAIEWADSIGIDVASTSLGYLGYDAPYISWTWVNLNGNTTVITRAADHAVAMGIVVVNSAGNGGPGNGTDNTLIAPADGDSVISAGAVGSTGVRASFSSVGPTTALPPRIKPDVMAMGVSVRVASSTNTVGYGSASGTSFSCPLTAGVAALILSAHPGLTPMQVRDAMRSTANNAASPNNQYGWGILDADSAIAAVGIVPMATLSGTVYHDLNGNGTQDPGEPPLAGRTVILAGATADTLPSGASGEFTFGGIAPGAHTLSVESAAGWIVTTPPAGLSASILHRDSLPGYSIGLFQTGGVAGTVYFDANQNGVKDPLEDGLQGWAIALTGPVTDTALTDPAGAYAFSGLPAGDYTLTQLPETDWIQFFPGAYGSHAFTVSSGYDASGLDFGNIYANADVFPVSAGWNLLSLPVEMLHPVADSIYPNALSTASFYSTGYYTLDTLVNGRGYWIKFPAAQNILIAGIDRTRDTVTVSQGWNLIGGLTGPVAVSTIVQDPPAIVESNFYGFEANAYVGLAPGDALLPHRGYWVKCSAPGILVLDSAIPAR